MSANVPGKAMLGVQQVSHAFGAQTVLKDITVTLHEGDRVGLIGRNGCGKSTFMKILAGVIRPDEGLVTSARGLRVALLEQQCTPDLDGTVGGALEAAGADRRAQIAAYHDALHQLGEIGADSPAHARLESECSRLQHEIEVHGGWDLPRDTKQISTALDLPAWDRRLGTLSGGELRRVDLAAKLISRPDVLLLDEPTNHIDTQSVDWIERFLARYEGTCVLVTHDRYFLDRVVNRIVEIEFSRVYTFPGSYGRFLEYKAQVEAAEARAEHNRQALIRRELTWFRRGAKAHLRASRTGAAGKANP